jgi:hypothetical protein
MADTHRIDVTLTADEVAALCAAQEISTEQAATLREQERDDRDAGLHGAAASHRESALAAERAAEVLRWLVGEGPRP